MSYIDPDDAGHWEGTTFVFTPPLLRRTESGRVVEIRVVDTSEMVLGDGVTKHDMIHALLNPIESDDEE